MNRLLSCLIYISTLAICGTLLLSCDWDLPGRKSQRNCTKPTGTIAIQVQQRKIDCAITGNAGTIDRVIWDFGNGSTTITSGLTVSYTYPEPGTYTIKATLTNTCLLETTLQQTVTVSNAVPPTVTLQPTTGVSTTSATAGMTITSTGNATVTRYGICWSTNPLPTITDRISERRDVGGLNTPFSFSMTGLLSNTVYYVRSFAVNALATTPGYSEARSFTTSQNPEVKTLSPGSVGFSEVTVNFIVNVAGNPPATEYGICYSSNTSLPNLENAILVPVGAPAVGTPVAVNLKGLTPNKLYYYRAYTKSASGEIIYGDVLSFTTQVDTLTEGLIASVSFTDRSLLDVSGNNNNVRLVGSPTFTTDHTGKANSAILLDGQQDYFYMPENSTLNPDALSISIWIKPTTVVRWMQIYNKSRFSDGAFEMYSSLIRPNPDSPGGVYINTDIKQNSNCQGGIGWQTFTFPGRPDLSKWHHVVMTYSGRTARMYFDNALLYKEDNLPAERIDNMCYGGDLKFGVQSRALPNFFYGAIDDIRIYRRPLSVAEVQTLFNQ